MSLVYISGPIRVNIPENNDVRVDVPSPVYPVPVPTGPQGLPGVSPTVSVTDIEGGHRVAITSVDGTESFDVMDGEKGETGATGPAGADGADGVGVPTGGTTGQVLKKKSNTDYDTEWSNISSSEVDHDGTSVSDLLGEEINESGSVATFDDAVGGHPIQSLTVTMTPQQNLNGYDNPWPGGGGKNLLPNKETAVNHDVTFTLGADGGYTLSGTANGNAIFDIGRDTFSLPAGTYRLTLSGTSNAQGNLFKIVGGTATYMQGANSTFALTETTSLFVRLLISSGTAASGKAYVQIESGSSNTGYAPYSNICPITGHTEAKVWRTGKNLFPGLEQGAYDSSTGNKVNSATIVRSTDLIPVIPGVAYALHRTVATSYINVRCYDINGSFIGTGATWLDVIQGTSAGNPMGNGVNSCVIKSKSGCYYLGINDYSNDLTSKYTMVVGSTPDTDYEAYSGTSVTIDLNSTIYGGTLDVASGVLTVTTANIASYNGESINEPWVSSMDKYVSGATPTTGAQVVYTLATPVTYQLTPQQVNTLVGENNVWSDAGDVTVTVGTGLLAGVSSVNGKSGVVTLDAEDVGALPDNTTYVSSVNGSSGAVTVTVPQSATATPADLGTAAVGTSAKYAKEDHVHKMPSASDVGAMSKWELLWTNTSPSSVFAPQDVTIDTSYDFYLVVVMNTNFDGVKNAFSCNIIPPYSTDSTHAPAQLFAWSFDSYPLHRQYWFTSTGIHFEGGYYGVATNSGTNNYCIPYKIYGIKGILSV